STIIVYSTDRNYEYIHKHWCWNMTYGGVDKYGGYSASYLKPFIDENYRTLLSAKHTVIVG
ncbi:unnamed protein product, partial [Didymodactylos carnosus]